MQDIITSILDAEKKAEENIKLANDKAKIIINDGENQAEKIRNNAISLFNLHKKTKISETEQLAQERYNEVIKKGKEDCFEVVSDAENKKDNVAKLIVKGIIE